VSIAPSVNPFAPPPVTVNPRSTGVSPSLAFIVTTTFTPSPLIVVDPAPDSLCTLIAFAPKSIGPA
jgi:hypothetical protein